MNLHNIVRNVISTINPDQQIQVIYYRGYDNTGVEPVLTYADPIALNAQVQPVSSEDIQFINNYMSSSIYKNVYLNGDLHALNKPLQCGRDKIIWNGQQWAVQSLPEGWTATAGWQKIMIVSQNEVLDGD